MKPKQLIRAVEHLGWRVVRVRGGWMIYPPDKQYPPVTVHRTESDHRAMRNTIARLRKAGARLNKEGL